MLNVILLGLAFMLVFTAWQTMGNVQTTILNSAKKKGSPGYVEGFTGDGFTSLAMIYASFSLSNWFAPSVVALLGPKLTMVAGGAIYSLFIAQIAYPNNYLLYIGSLLLGVGAAIIWTAQGNFLTLNSDSNSMSRNSGIFWAMLQMSMLIGNTFVYFQFRGLEDVDKDTRTVVTMTLLGVGLVGTAVFLLLRPTSSWSGSDSTAAGGPYAALKRAFAIFITKDMLLLSITNFYTGLMLTFWSGVYGPSIANTQAFGKDAKSLNGMHGIFVGLGEIIGGLGFGILGHVMVKRGRDPVVILGFVCNVVAFFLAFLNLPLSAPLMHPPDVQDPAFISSNAYLAIFTSFLFGFGDACYNTQIYSIIGAIYKDDSAPAFALFKFIQSFSAAIAFFYSGYLMLQWQLLILMIACVAGTVCFCLLEFKTRTSTALSQRETSSPITEPTTEHDNSYATLPQEDNQDLHQEQAAASSQL